MVMKVKKGVRMKFLLPKKGQEASSWGHLGGWIIALLVLVIIVVIMLTAFGVIDLSYIRNARLG